MCEQLTGQNGNPTSTTKRTMIQTTWSLSAKWKFKHHINKTENNDKLHFSQETQHNTEIRQTYKRQTTNKYFSCNNNETQTKNTNNENTNTNDQKHKQVIVQNEDSNNTTERTMLRTTWLLITNLEHKQHINQKAKQEQTFVLQQKKQDPTHRHS